MLVSLHTWRNREKSAKVVQEKEREEKEKERGPWNLVKPKSNKALIKAQLENKKYT